MHTSILLFTLGLTLAAASTQFPRQQNDAEFLTTTKPYIPIISRNEIRDDSGQVISSYQSADGTSFEQVDVLKPSLNPKKPKVIVQQGTYSYTSPDGTPVQVSYIADEKGFRAVGTHIFGEVPVVPDVPENEPSRIERGAPLKVTFPSPPVSVPEPTPVSFPAPPRVHAPAPTQVSFSSPPPVPASAPFPVAFHTPPPAPLPTPFPAAAFPTRPPVPAPALSQSAAPAAPVYPFQKFPSAPGAQINPTARSQTFATNFGREF